MARATDWCGVRSGRDFDKWKECGLTPVAAEHVAAPVIAEAPLSIECRVRQIVKLGSHDMFIADVVGILADERYIDPTTGRFSLEAAKPLVYLHGEYFRLGEMIGHFGWSVRKKKRRSGAKRPQGNPTARRESLSSPYARYRTDACRSNDNKAPCRRAAAEAPPPRCGGA